MYGLGQPLSVTPNLILKAYYSKLLEPDLIQIIHFKNLLLNKKIKNIKNAWVIFWWISFVFITIFQYPTNYFQPPNGC